MKNENKSLIEYKKESIISKIINFFKYKFFKKNNSIPQNKIEPCSKTEENNIKLNNEVTNFNSLKTKNDKEQLFKLYNDFKSNKIAIENISLYDILRITKLLEEERKICNSRK